VSTIYYLTTEVISLTFIALELLICVVSRLTAIFGLSMLFRLHFKHKWTVSNNELSIVSIAGTIRGSVAFALILTIESNEHNSDEVSVIKSTTLIMVCLTTIVLGALMPKFIKCFLGSPAQSHLTADSLQTDESIKPEAEEPLL
jgi:NhaP-type Na+/H+ or K+/H+ antiporter